MDENMTPAAENTAQPQEQSKSSTQEHRPERGDRRGGRPPFGQRRDGRNRDQFGEKDDLKKKLVTINRVTKVVKGGRNMRFAALVVVGDEKGKVGIGMGKAAEVASAIEKATQNAKRNMIVVPMNGTTLPHEVRGKFGKADVLMMPAGEGTGLIAGGPVRAVLELAGVKDVRTKSYGSNNPVNCLNATMEGLKLLRTAEQIAALRGKTVAEIIG